MSGPDEGMLTAQERAALASLEARAAADDPRLADHLKGLRPKERLRALPKPELGWLTTVVRRSWGALHPMVFGPLGLVAGLALVVLGLSVSLALSLVGVAAAALGLALLTQVATVRLQRRGEQTRLRAGSSPD